MTGNLLFHNVTHTGYYFDPVVMFISGLAPMVLAIIIGIPLLSKLRGDYFAFGTLAVGEILASIALKMNFFGGAVGLQLSSNVYTSVLGMHIRGNGTIFGPISGALLVGALFAYGTIYLKNINPILEIEPELIAHLGRNDLR